MLDLYDTSLKAVLGHKLYKGEDWKQARKKSPDAFMRPYLFLRASIAAHLKPLPHGCPPAPRADKLVPGAVAEPYPGCYLTKPLPWVAAMCTALG